MANKKPSRREALREFTARARDRRVPALHTLAADLDAIGDRAARKAARSCRRYAQHLENAGEAAHRLRRQEHERAARKREIERHAAAMTLTGAMVEAAALRDAGSRLH